MFQLNYFRWPEKTLSARSSMKLGKKILLIVISVLFVSLSISSAVLVVNFKKSYTEALLTGSYGLGQSLNSIVTELLSLGLPLESFTGMDSKCAQLLKNNPHITYAGIADISGRILYNGDSSLVGKVMTDKVMKTSIASLKPITQLYRRFDGLDYYDVTIPIIDAANVHLGMIRLGFRTTVVNDKVFTALLQVIINFSISFIVIAVLLNYFISRFVTRPVISISEHAKEIAGGDYDVNLAVTTGDELGNLADSINRLSCEVKRNTCDLEAANSELKLKLIEREAADLELTRYREHLEELVEERTAELHQRSAELLESQQALMNIVEDLNEKSADLQEANSRLQEVDRLKSMFIASMSHELRTPLNSIIGFSSILHDGWIGPINAEQKENLAIILRCGKHLLNLINDVIDVSKVEAGRIESVAEEFDLQGLVDEAVSLVRKEADGKGIFLRVENVHLQMRTDRRRLLQCVLNLLSNALKYTESGGVTVTSRLVPGAGEMLDTMELCVTDTGIGIREENLPRMFEPFVRLASPLQSTVPGTGLGLYLTRKLTVDVLKGDITMTSEYSRGSCFTIKVPVRLP